MKAVPDVFTQTCLCLCVFFAHLGKMEVKIHKALITVDTEKENGLNPGANNSPSHDSSHLDDVFLSKHVGGTFHSILVQPVKMEHLQRWSRIFLPDQTKMACSV